MQGNYNRSPNYLMMAIFILLLCMISSFIKPASTNDRLLNEETKPVVTLADDYYIKVNSEESINEYKTNIISCKNDGVFTLRRVVNNNGIGDYQITTRINSGDFKVLTVDEDKVDIYILGDSTVDPYAIMQITPGSKIVVTSMQVYLPANHNIEVVNKSDSTYSNYNTDINNVIEPEINTTPDVNLDSTVKNGEGDK